MGMLPDCCKLGLGVLEVFSAAGTGPDVMASSAGAAAGYPELYIYMSVKIT